MRKNIFAVCDLEVDYACNFMEYLTRKKNIPFEIRAFTTVDGSAGRAPGSLLGGSRRRASWAWSTRGSFNLKREGCDGNSCKSTL